MDAGAGAEQLKENEKAHAKLIIEWHCLLPLLFILGYFEKKLKAGPKKKL